MLFHYAVRGGQAETHATTTAECREERFEQAYPGRVIHPMSAVADAEHYVASEPRARMRFEKLCVQLDTRGFEEEPATVRHCFTSVPREVDDQLLNLSGIRLNARNRRIEHAFELNPVTQKLLQLRTQTDQQTVEVKSVGLHDLLLAKSQELRRQRCSPLRGTVDIFHVTAMARVSAHTIPQELGPSEDHRE